MAGGYGSQNYFKSDTLKIKIYRENILTLNEENRTLISNILDEERPDFILLNECRIGKAKINMSGDKIELYIKKKSE